MSISEKLTTIAENQEKVFDAGKKAEYDAFWDSFQTMGTRTDYGYGFFSNNFDVPCWNSETFRPKYDMIPNKCSRMFFNLKDFDFAERLNEQGVILDTSKATDISYMFQNSWVYTIPTIDGSKVTSSTGYYGIFGYSRVRTIEKFVVKNNLEFANTFISCSMLENITFGGEIGRGLNMSACPLTVESMKSVITHLHDYSTESPATYTISFSSNCWANLEASGKPYGDGLTDDESFTWQEYVYNDLGWNT